MTLYQVSPIILNDITETNGRNPGSAELTALLGLSLVVYGSVISFLVARLVTYENWEKIFSLATQENFPVLTPFILSPIVIYVVMEFWRVANTTTGGAVTTGWFLYDILALLFALLALQGFHAGIDKLPTDLSGEVSQVVLQEFCMRISFGCFFLAAFLASAVGRFWSALGFHKARWVIGSDSIGVVMSLAAGYWLTLQPLEDSLFLVFFMSFGGFFLAVGYLIHDLWARAD